MNPETIATWTGGGAVVLALATLFVRAMMRQDFGAWKIVASHEKTIARQQLVIDDQDHRIAKLEDELSVKDEEIRDLRIALDRANRKREQP